MRISYAYFRALVLAKLYANTFLASLNNCYIMRHLSTNTAGVAVESSTISSTSLPMQFLKPARKMASGGAEKLTVLSTKEHIMVQEGTFVAHGSDLELSSKGANRGALTSYGGMKGSVYNGVARNYPL